MGGLTILIVVSVAIVAALLGRWAYRRFATPEAARSGKNEARNQAEQWGIRISAPAKERACPTVRELLGKEFPIDEEPRLPLPSCPFPHQCECSYTKVFDRRREEQRSGQERREARQRFEKDKRPRRCGKDRRKDMDINWT
jgi:hypothetical protein